MNEKLGLAKYLDNLRIRKTALGGFDREDVYRVLQEIEVLYRETLTDLEQKNESLLQQLAEAHDMAESRQRDFELRSEPRESRGGGSADRVVQHRLEVLDKVIQDFHKGSSGILEDARVQAAALLEEARGQSEDIVNQAYSHASEIVDLANSRASKILLDARQAAQKIEEGGRKSAERELERALAVQQETRQCLLELREAHDRIGILMNRYGDDPEAEKARSTPEILALGSEARSDLNDN